jgi:hypothetical protein
MRNALAKAAFPKGALSSVGRASRLHREGQRFEPVSAHHIFDNDLQFIKNRFEGYFVHRTASFGKAR